MLPAEHRMRRAREFESTMRHGVRAGRPLVVVHMASIARPGEPVHVGFVVGGSVGGAVVRNTLRRRLRHLMRDRLELLPAGTRLVIRARPEAANAASEALAAELDVALDRVLRGLEARR